MQYQLVHFVCPWNGDSLAVIPSLDTLAQKHTREYGYYLFTPMALFKGETAVVSSVKQVCAGRMCQRERYLFEHV